MSREILVGAVDVPDLVDETAARVADRELDPDLALLAEARGHAVPGADVLDDDRDLGASHPRVPAASIAKRNVWRSSRSRRCAEPDGHAERVERRVGRAGVAENPATAARRRS